MEYGRYAFLIVEDYPDLRRAIRMTFERLGATADEAGDGALALEKLRAKPYDLVLTDRNMPVMGGFELLAAMRSDPVLAGIPVILMTADNIPPGFESLVRSRGADGLLRKPFAAEALEAEIQRIFAARSA